MGGIKVIFELSHAICECGEWGQGEWKWSIRPDSNHWLSLTCKKCNTALLTNCSAFIRYKELEQKVSKTDIKRTMTQREAQIFDAVKSELYGIIKHRFEDGFYWVDLCTSYSEEEANLMHHCGKDSGGSLWSLRDANKIPHLTITVKENKYVITLRGRHNKVPKNINKYNHCIEYLHELGLEFNMEEILKEEKND